MKRFDDVVDRLKSAISNMKKKEYFISSNLQIAKNREVYNDFSISRRSHHSVRQRESFGF